MMATFGCGDFLQEIGRVLPYWALKSQAAKERDGLIDRPMKADLPVGTHRDRHGGEVKCCADDILQPCAVP